jgi:isoleucyl-tRNA synthetase
MSKSVGNVISPHDIIKEYGADILRMWVASSDYNEDIRISKEILTRLSEAYRKIRNTARFMLSNLYDFNPDTDKVNYRDLLRIDRWIIFRARKVVENVLGAYGPEERPSFEFHKAFKLIYEFCNEDLSMYYLDMAKGRLYTAPACSRERRACQSVIHEILFVITRMIAPVMVFTSDEIWQHIPKGQAVKAIPNVHLLPFPSLSGIFPEAAEDKELEEIIKLIPEIAKALEEKRGAGVIGSSFDAQINLLTNDQIRYKSLESLKADLPEVFKVSSVTVGLGECPQGAYKSSELSGTAISVAKARGRKCPRCWNYSTDTGWDPNHPDICQKCLKAL